jgi:spermidine synthase
VDGRLFVKRNVKADEGRRFDVVILNLPDPNTAQLNRLYTAEFFGMIKSLLNEGGVFSFRVSSAENYISRELGLYLSSIYRTLKSAFAEVRILPGSNNVFLASEEKGLLFDDWKILGARLSRRNISTRFVNENFLPDRLSPLRLALLEDAISEKEGRLNSDLKPICYFYNGILWGKQFKSLEKSILLHLSGVHSAWLPGAIVLAFSAGFLLCMLGRSKSSNLALAAIFAAGFTSIFVEIIVVLSFQMFHGYIYSMIGLIFTLFMLGLFVGAAAVQEGASRGRIGFKGLALVQLLQLVFVLLLLMVVWAFAKSAAPDLVVLAVLLFFVTVSGILGGVLFALANHLFLRRETTRRAGTGYSIDLFGASLSSLLAAAILIPLLGIPASLVMLVLINMICFGSLLTLLRAK